MDWFRKRNLGSLLNAAAENFGNREALVFDEQRSSYSTLKNNIDPIAKGLMAISAEIRERAALWTTNRPEWLYLCSPSPVLPPAMSSLSTPPIGSSGKIRKVELRTQALNISDNF